jgi:hypothetical protein
VLDPLHDELRDAVEAAQLQHLARVVVDHHDLQLTAVAGVDSAGRVHDRDAVPGRQAGARVDERGVAVRQRDGQPGPQHDALTRRDLGVLGGHQVAAGVARVGVRGQRHLRVQPADQDLQHGRPLARRGVARDRATDDRTRARTYRRSRASRSAPDRKPHP